MTVLTGALLFLVAGTVRWTWAWLYLAVLTAVLSSYSWLLLVRHPDLSAEREHPPEGAKSWDRPFVLLIGKIGPMALLLFCALDRRLGLSAAMPAAAAAVGLAMVAAGGAVTSWAVAHNRFFSAVVRIQRDRGHVVVDSGPYGVVRHPGYAGSLLHTLGTSLALGSWWSLAISVPVCVLIVIRTALEDRTLRHELDGYEAYAGRTRGRLLPNLW